MECRGTDGREVGVGYSTPDAMIVGDEDGDVTALVGIPSRVAGRASRGASHLRDCRGARLMGAWYGRGGDHR